jgi:hypothetical protein
MPAEPPNESHQGVTHAGDPPQRGLVPHWRHRRVALAGTLTDVSYGRAVARRHVGLDPVRTDGDTRSNVGVSALRAIGVSALRAIGFAALLAIGFAALPELVRSAVPAIGHSALPGIGHAALLAVRQPALLAVRQPALLTVRVHAVHAVGVAMLPELVSRAVPPYAHARVQHHEQAAQAEEEGEEAGRAEGGWPGAEEVAARSRA